MLVAEVRIRVGGMVAPAGFNVKQITGGGFGHALKGASDCGTGRAVSDGGFFTVT